MSTNPHAKTADTFRRLADDLDHDRKPATRPQHLSERLYRTEVQAGRLILSIVEGQHCPNVLENLRGLAGKLGDRSGANVAMYWRTFVVPYLGKRHGGAFKGNAGNYAYPTVKTDAEGQPLGKDGQVLEGVEHKDEETGRTSWRLEGQMATIADDFDDADGLDYLGNRADDYANACRLLAGLLEPPKDTRDPMARAIQLQIRRWEQETQQRLDEIEAELDAEPSNPERRCNPMPKVHIARRLLNDANARARKADKLMERQGLRSEAGNLWTIRLDGLTAEQVERLTADRWPPPVDLSKPQS